MVSHASARAEGGPDSGRLLVAALVLVAMFAVPASPAEAGRLLATGHDVDGHCDPGDGPAGDQCGFMQVATEYVRGGAPDPSRPALLLDCSGEVAEAFDEAFPGAGASDRTVMCPSEAADGFASEPLTTDRYSAIVVGSSCHDSLNLVADCDEEGGSTPDSDAINARQADIEAFFNAGGGIFAMSGEDNGDGDATTGPDTYYDFLPLPVGGRETSGPYCLTDAGIALGFEDQACPDASRHAGTRDDINCCETHNSFAEPPEGSRLQVSERDTGDDDMLDADDAPETLFAEGEIRGGEIVAPPADDGAPPDREPAAPREEDRGSAPPRFAGGPGSDCPVTGLPAADVLDGGLGDDCLFGRGADDTVSGGSGNDRLGGDAARDTISGGPGQDQMGGGADRDFLTGDGGHDEITGDAGSDIADGGAGNDRLLGGAEVDSLNGGAGDDDIRGGGDHDGITGASGNDVLRGGEGNDRIAGGLGKDRISGGPGNDNVVAIDGQTDLVRCGPGRDTVRADGGDRIGSDCERVIQRRGDFDADDVPEPAARDLAFVGAGGARITGDGSPKELRGTGGNDTIDSPLAGERLLGLGGADRLGGGSGNDRGEGGPGVDVLSGGPGIDVLLGGGERDFVEGGPGGDQLQGVAGSNVMNGATGNDRLVGGPRADSLNGGSDEDVILAGPGGDGITGASGDDRLFGQDGNDRIEGGLGKDRISAGAGDDNVVSADGQVDAISCGSGRDVIRADGDDQVGRDCEVVIARVGNAYAVVRR